MNVSLDGPKRPAVEHFAGGGSDSASGDLHDTVGGIFEGIEYGQQGAHVFGQAQKFYRDFRNQRERSFGTDYQAGEIVTGSLHRSPADAHHFGVRAGPVRGR